MKPKQTLLITGATGQIGRHIVTQLAKPGMRIILHTHQNHEEAKRLQKKFKSTEIIIISEDLSSFAGISSFIEQILPYRPFDFFLHNAALFTQDPFEKLITLHVTSALKISRKIAPHMRNGSHIVFMNDIGTRIPFKKHLDYCLSKGAILSLTRSLAVEMAPKTLVNCLTLGPIMATKSESKKIQKIIQNRTLLKHWGGAEEVFQAIQFLRSSKFITGTEIIIDGGYQLVPGL